MSDAFDNVMPPGRGRPDDQPPAREALVRACRVAAQLNASAARMTREGRIEACEQTVGPFWREHGFELDDGIYLHDFDGGVIGELRGVHDSEHPAEAVAHLWLDYGPPVNDPDDPWPFARLWRPVPES